VYIHFTLSAFIFKSVSLCSAISIPLSLLVISLNKMSNKTFCLSQFRRLLTFCYFKLKCIFSLDNMAAETPSEFQLKNPPTDGITAVKFGPNSSQFLLTSSWDTSVRLYDVIANHLRMKYNHPAPVLDCCFHVNCYLI